jgi:DNA-binding response OmpR family regulator
MGVFGMASDYPMDGMAGGALSRKYGVTAAQRILMVEGNRDTARLVAFELERAGYDVLIAGSDIEALDLIEQIGLPHLAVVDVRPPGMDGLEFCSRVLQFSDLPIVIVTVVYERDFILRVIGHDVEDYVTRPFSPRELVARIQRVLRRTGGFGYALAPLMQVDDNLAVDFAHQQVVFRGQAVSTTPLETKILYILMRHAGRVVTTDYLLRRLWPQDEVGEDILRVHVDDLRRKIEVDPPGMAYILTVRESGYSFPVPCC